MLVHAALSHAKPGRDGPAATAMHPWYVKERCERTKRHGMDQGPRFGRRRRLAKLERHPLHAPSRNRPCRHTLLPPARKSAQRPDEGEQTAFHIFKISPESSSEDITDIHDAPTEAHVVMISRCSSAKRNRQPTKCWYPRCGGCHGLPSASRTTTPGVATM